MRQGTFGLYICGMSGRLTEKVYELLIYTSHKTVQCCFVTIYTDLLHFVQVALGCIVVLAPSYRVA